MTGADHSDDGSTDPECSGAQPPHGSQPTPEQLTETLDASRMRGKAIRCAPADGPQTDFLNLGRKVHPRTWLGWRETGEAPFVADTDDVSEEIREAWPGVYPIAEEESRWGEE